MTIDISVYPNPFDQYIILEITCHANIDCIILLSDLEQGKIIRMMGASLKAGTNRVPMNDLQQLTAGNYNLEIKTAGGGSLFRTRLFKQSAESPFIHLN